jgi:predicted flap endonuclease-1-like 5' DNA nuclease
MGYPIEEIEGIGPANREKLAAASIKTTDDLLEKCCAPGGRKEVEASTGIGASQLLKWTNMADLMRVSGIGRQYSELLEAAGVDTVKELRNRNAANLAEKMAEINGEKKLAKTSPSESVVEGWVDQAKTMDPKISY